MSHHHNHHQSVLPAWMCAGPRNQVKQTNKRTELSLKTDQTTTLSFVSYNLLADLLTGEDAGFSSEKEDLMFEHRALKLLKMIFPNENENENKGKAGEEEELGKKRMNASEDDDDDENNEEAQNGITPDVICVQECDHYYDFFEPEMQKRGYFGVFREDKWSPCLKFSTDVRDGLAIFAKKETCELVGMHISTHAEQKDQDAKVLFARLVMKKSLTRQEVVVINAHLESGQSPDKVVTRVNQAKEMCSRLNAFCVAQCSNINTVQIVVCGDFNATPEEPCMEHLRGRGLKSAFSDLELTGAGKDKEQQQQQQIEGNTNNEENREPFFTTFKTRLGFFKNGTSKRCSDYIMYSAHRGAKIVSRVVPQQDSFGENVIGLPSKTQPSDHLLLRARVSFKDPIIASPNNNAANK
jgi:nocturnin